MSLIPASLQKTSQWISKRIDVVAADETITIQVDAKVYGAFAIHECLDMSGKLTLTHVPTGRFVMHLADEAQLRIAGEWLWARHCMTFRLKDREQIRAKTEDWVKPWRDLCMAKGKFLVPQS